MAFFSKNILLFFNHVQNVIDKLSAKVFANQKCEFILILK